MSLIRVLLAGENASFVHAIQNFVAQDPAIAIVGRAASGPEVLEKVAELAPGVVVIDMALAPGGGLAATRQIKARPDPPRVIVLSLFDNCEYRAEADRAGADGFVDTSEIGVKLLPLIRRLCPLSPPFPDTDTQSSAAAGQVQANNDERKAGLPFRGGCSA